jgi:hypothetical protein
MKAFMVLRWDKWIQKHRCGDSVQEKNNQKELEFPPGWFLYGKSSRFIASFTLSAMAPFLRGHDCEICVLLLLLLLSMKNQGQQSDGGEGFSFLFRRSCRLLRLVCLQEMMCTG